MRAPSEELGDFRLADILSLLAVRRWGSLTAAARDLKVTPSQISKSVTRLEQQLDLALLVRSPQGVCLTDYGEQVIPHLQNLILHWQRALQLRNEPLRQVTIAAPSYMNMVFVPYIAACHPQLRIRDLEMPPPMIRAFITHNLFDLVLALGKPALPETWTATCVGEVRKALFANPLLAQRLMPNPLEYVAASALSAVPFICPINTFNGQFVPLDDGCPLKPSTRRIGHEVTTLLLALELAAHTEQLVFGPAIAAQRYVDNRMLVEIPVVGWHVSEPLYLVCNGDRILAADQQSIVDALRTALAAHSAPPADSTQGRTISPPSALTPLHI